MASVFPSLAGMLWIAVALTLNAVAVMKPVGLLSRAGIAMILPVPLFVGVFLGYAIYVLFPILASDSLRREAVAAVAFYQEEVAKPPSQRENPPR